MKNKYLITTLLVMIALSERLFFDLGPNAELVTTGMIIAAAFLGSRASIFFVLATMIISDLIIGNSTIWLFTYSGFLIPALAASIILKKDTSTLLATGTGIGANMFFYLWTNFGVWAQGNGSMYPHTATGLMQSYINGLPFLKMQFMSTLLILPVSFLLIHLVLSTLKASNQLQELAHQN